ncbi:hypothetical protein [Pseudomonas veronii]|uniref:hypothetical protein n=1 Tax=Pseudomonas veronii TaxID=76761 RepID=UPI0018FF5C38|nr:hypothetical protein [Pseudomonas veronii]
MARQSPNPTSKMLAKAVVAGAGIGMPGVTPPPGMGAVLLYVPLGDILGKSPIDIQADLGMPWHVEDGPGVWFDEL